MKPFILISLLGVALVVIPEIDGEYSCKTTDIQMTEEWRKMKSTCTNKMMAQVQMELEASMTYLAMGSYFLQDQVNRPGFAKFFLDSASEERQHALKIMEYLLMRGELAEEDNYKKLILSPKPAAIKWDSGVDALKNALVLETGVTKSIRNIIAICEGNETPKDNKDSTNTKNSNKDIEDTGNNDYHLVDWLTGDFLDEQYKGQRELAGKISTLSKMMKVHGDLGEFLYDKTLL